MNVSAGASGNRGLSAELSKCLRRAVVPCIDEPGTFSASMAQSMLLFRYSGPVLPQTPPIAFIETK